MKIRLACFVALTLGAVAGELACTTLPTPKHGHYRFPSKHAFIGDVSRPYEKLGLVRARSDFQTLDPQNDEQDLCNNYFNQAVHRLLKIAKQKNADAVIDVKSVVFTEDGRREEYSSAQCSDDGAEGQVLVQGVAVKWKPASASPGPSPAPSPSQKAAVAPSPMPLPASRPEDFRGE